MPCERVRRMSMALQLLNASRGDRIKDVLPAVLASVRDLPKSLASIKTSGGEAGTASTEMQQPLLNFRRVMAALLDAAARSDREQRKLIVLEVVAFTRDLFRPSNRAEADALSTILNLLSSPPMPGDASTSSSSNNNNNENNENDNDDENNHPHQSPPTFQQEECLSVLVQLIPAGDIADLEALAIEAARQCIMPARDGSKGGPDRSERPEATDKVLGPIGGNGKPSDTSNGGDKDDDGERRAAATWWSTSSERARALPSIFAFLLSCSRRPSPPKAAVDASCSLALALLRGGSRGMAGTKEYAVRLASACAAEQPGLSDEAMEALLLVLSQIRLSSWGSGAIERLLDAVLDGILSIMHSDPDVHAGPVLTALVAFCHAGGDRGKWAVSASLVERATPSLCKVLRVVGKTSGGSETVTDIVHAVAASLFDETGGGEASAETKGAIALLGAIAIECGVPTITEAVQGLILEGLQSLPGGVHDLLLHQLTGMAISMPPSSPSTRGKGGAFRVVVDLIFSRYSRPFDASTLGLPPLLRKELPVCLARLARSLGPGPEKDDFERRLLTLFDQLARETQRHVFQRGRGSKVQQHGGNKPGQEAEQQVALEQAHMLGSLLPALAAALAPPSDGHAAHPAPWERGGVGAGGRQRLFRNLWCYCVMFGFVGSWAGNATSWPPEWQGACRVIASASPTILGGRGGGGVLLENEMELSEIVSGTWASHTSRLRSAYAKALPARYRDAALNERRVSVAQCVFGMAVLELERLRAQGSESDSIEGGLSAVLDYSGGLGPGGWAIGISNKSASMEQVGGMVGGHVACIEGVIYRVVDLFIENLAKSVGIAWRDQVLGSQVGLLLRSLLSHVPGRRAAAERALKLILKRFPYIHWNFDCFSLAMEVYERGVYEAKAPLDQLHSTKAAHQEGDVADEASRRKGSGGGGVGQRHVALKTAEGVARGWIEAAIGQSPLLGTTLFGLYSEKCRIAPSFATNLVHEVMVSGGGALAGAATGGHRMRGGELMWRCWGCWAVYGGVDMASILSGVSHRARSNGQARDFPAGRQGFVQAASRMESARGGADFSAAMGALAGLVVREGGGGGWQEAVRCLARYPFQRRGGDIRQALEVWAWIIISCSPRIKSLLVDEVCGMFGNAWRGGVCSDSGSQAHALCAEFIQELVHCTAGSSESCVGRIAACLPGALDLLGAMQGVHPAKVQTLRLSLAVVGDAAVSLRDSALLLDRVLRSGLDIFADIPTWSDEYMGGANPGVARSRGGWVVVPWWTGTSGGGASVGSRMSQVQILMQLGVGLQLLFFKSASDKSVDAMSGAWARGSDLVMAVGDAAGRGKWERSEQLVSETMSMSSLRTLEDKWLRLMSDRRETSQIGSDARSPSDVKGNTLDRGGWPQWGGTEEGELQSRARLLVVFIASEVRRVSVWHSPRTAGSESVLEGPLSHPDAQFGWTSLAKVAWGVHPHLALMLALRHPKAEITRIIAQNIRSAPSMLLRLGPQAAKVASLVAVFDDVLPHLGDALSSCPPSPLEDCLVILSRTQGDVSHPLLAAFVAKSIMAASTTSLLQLLPQLTRFAIYRDPSNQIASALAYVASRPEGAQIAHNLHWILALDMSSSTVSLPTLSNSFGANDFVVPAAKKKSGAASQSGAGGGQGDNKSGSESRSRCAFLLSEVHSMSAQGHREAVGAQVEFVEGLIKACRLVTSQAHNQVGDLVEGNQKLVAELKKLPFAGGGGKNTLFVPTEEAQRVTSGFAFDQCKMSMTNSRITCTAAFIVSRIASAAGNMTTQASDSSQSDGPMSRLSHSDSPISRLHAAASRREILTRATGTNSDPHRPATEEMDVRLLHITFKPDGRAEALACQVISCIRDILGEARVEAYLRPYVAIPVASDATLVQVVPGTRSREQLSRASDNLHQYFLQTFGAVNSEEFHRARSCFVQSLAGHCLVSFLLQIRERSHVNFFIDDEGHVIHCDLSHILSAAPQGDNFMGPVETLTFMSPAERGPFRITPDMLEIMGGTVDAEPFKYFNNLVIRAFLAVRLYSHRVLSLVALMADAGLHCIKKDTVENLRARLAPEKNEREAAQFIHERMKDIVVNGTVASGPL